MKSVAIWKFAGDEITLLPDVNVCIQRASPFSFGFIPDTIEIEYNNLAVGSVLTGDAFAPRLVVGFPDLFSPEEGVIYSFSNLHQKYRAAAALANMSYADWIRKNYTEISRFFKYVQVIVSLEDCELMVRAW